MRSLVSSLFFLCFINCENTYASADLIEVDLFIKDHIFSPKILELPSGKKIRITVHNQDSTIEEFESDDLKREKIILGNSKTVVVLAPLKSGEYKFFGDFHQDTAQGKIIITDIEKEEEKDV